MHLAIGPSKSSPLGQDRVHPHLPHHPERLLQPLPSKDGRDQHPVRGRLKPRTMRKPMRGAQAPKNRQPLPLLILWLWRINCEKGCFVSGSCSPSRVSKVARNLHPRSDLCWFLTLLFILRPAFLDFNEDMPSYQNFRSFFSMKEVRIEGPTDRDLLFPDCTRFPALCCGRTQIRLYCSPGCSLTMYLHATTRAFDLHTPLLT